jgi:hypothetical protein
MEIAKRVIIEKKSLVEQHGKLPAGLSVVIGHKESVSVELEATTRFFFDRASGNENLMGLPIVRVDQESYFAVEVPEQ